MWAAPSPTVLLGTGAGDVDETDATSYTTGAFAITANKPITMAVTSRTASPPVTQPTFTYYSATWVLVDRADVTLGVQQQSTFVFRAMLGSNSGTEQAQPREEETVFG